MSSTSDTNTPGAGSGEKPRRRAGAFDIRTFIALLIGIYGVVLVLMGIIGPEDEHANAASINLYAGIGMMVVSAVFLTWARMRPVVVPEHVEPAEGQDHEPPRG
jgi:hypothetical protein